MKFMKMGAAAALILVTASCSGTMQGVIRGEGTPVQFQYEQGMDRDFYTATIDGENFSGQALDPAGNSRFVFNNENMEARVFYCGTHLSLPQSFIS